MKKSIFVLAAFMVAGLPFGDAAAQWNNAPYGASSGTSSFSMSNAHRQVILDQRAGTLPSGGQVYRDRSGALLMIERGPDNQAVVRDRSGVERRIPRGRSWQGQGFGYGGRNAVTASGQSSGTGPSSPSVSGYVASMGNESLAHSQRRSSVGASAVVIWTDQLAAMGN